MNHSIEEARVAKSKIAKLLENYEAVNGVGIARVEAGFGVKVNLRYPLKCDVTIPTEVDGVPVVVQVVGEIRAL